MRIKIKVLSICFCLSILACLNVCALSVGSPSFKNGDNIPEKFTGVGADVSPELTWDGAPKDTKTFAVIVYDPDAPMGTWTHWVIYNIPGVFSRLPEGVPKSDVAQDGICQGINDFKKVGYGGPNPPAGTPHRYYFKLFALSGSVDFSERKSMSELLKQIEGKVLAEAETIGKFGR